MTRSCQLWGTLLFFITKLCFELGCEACDKDKCKSICKNYSDRCDPVWDCRSDNYNCCMKCEGEGCKQTCDTGVEVCEMKLECKGDDCDQTCKANTCKLNCSGNNCREQKCLKDGGLACEMDLECNNQDCEQICNAHNCNLTCSGEKCKSQRCQRGRNACEMHLECNGQDCDQTCNAKSCNLNCSGRSCKKQKCEDKVDVCEMHLECNDQDCEQICEAEECNLTCSGRKCKTQNCTKNTRVCNKHFNANDCTQMCDGHSIISDSYMSNIVTSIGVSIIRVFTTKISTGDETEAYTLLQPMSQSPLSLISPSLLLSSSSHSSSAAILPAEVSASPSTLLLSSSKPAATSASASASGSSSTASSEAISTGRASASSSALSPSSSKPTATSALGLSLAASSQAVLTAAALSSLQSSSSETSIAVSSSSPSLRTPLSSTLGVIKNLANDSVSKLKGEEISRIMSLMEAIRIFEDFITSIQILQKSLTKKEIEIMRNSILKVAVALEVFALNYGKHQMIGANSSVEINSRKLVLAIQKTYRKNASDFCLGKQELQTSLDISSKNLANNVSVVVGIVYKDLHDVLITDQPFRTITGATRYLDSWITAVALDPKPEKLQENVILRFRNLKIREGEKKCMFWSGSSESSGGFSETGCYLVTSKSNSEETVCSCNHLTHFAVLLDYNGSPGLTEEDETILEIITYVGLSLSIFAILLTIILYAYLTDVWQPLTQIRLSLSVSLGAGQIIFLTGINATENSALCVLAAAFLQYFLMAAFCWMLVEGIYFFLFVVKVYNINTKMHMYHFISWGLPLIMVSISISIAAGKDGIKSYTSEKYCWLSSTNNLIWIFITFVAFIEVLNILILVRVLKEMSELIQPTGENNNTQQIRLGIKTCAVMIPLLGVTWLFGLLLSLHKAFAYIFTIFNSIQGILVFLLHCVRNSQIRERLKRKMNIVFPSAADHRNSANKNSQVNPIDAGEVCAVKLQSFKE